MSAQAEPVVPRLALYAGVVLNAITALAWSARAWMMFSQSLPLYGVLYGVLVVMYTRTAWGFLQHDPRAYQRSFQVHLLGLIIDVAEVAFDHIWYLAPLAVIHVLALGATWLARTEFTRR